MKTESIINDFAKDLAKEITERNSYDLSAIETLIVVRTKDSLSRMIKEYTTKEELVYTKLVNKLAALKPGHKDANDIGVEIAVAKLRMSAARKFLKHQALKDFAIERLGESTVLEFLETITTE